MVSELLQGISLETLEEEVGGARQTVRLDAAGVMATGEDDRVGWRVEAGGLLVEGVEEEVGDVRRSPVVIV